MFHSTRAPAIVLLVALAFFVGVPPPVFAVDHPPVLEAPDGDTEMAPPDVCLVTSDGDPDEWSSNTGEEGSEGFIGSKPGDNDDWLDYLESIRDLIICIKLGLGGIL